MAATAEKGSSVECLGGSEISPPRTATPETINKQKSITEKSRRALPCGTRFTIIRGQLGSNVDDARAYNWLRHFSLDGNSKSFEKNESAPPSREASMRNSDHHEVDSDDDDDLYIEADESVETEGEYEEESEEFGSEAEDTVPDLDQTAIRAVSMRPKGRSQRGFMKASLTESVRSNGTMNASVTASVREYTRGLAMEASIRQIDNIMEEESESRSRSRASEVSHHEDSSDLLAQLQSVLDGPDPDSCDNSVELGELEAELQATANESENLEQLIDESDAKNRALQAKLNVSRAKMRDIEEIGEQVHRARPFALQSMRISDISHLGEMIQSASPPLGTVSDVPKRTGNKQQTDSMPSQNAGLTSISESDDEQDFDETADEQNVNIIEQAIEEEEDGEESDDDYDDDEEDFIDEEFSKMNPVLPDAQTSTEMEAIVSTTTQSNHALETAVENRATDMGMGEKTVELSAAAPTTNTTHKQETYPEQISDEDLTPSHSDSNIGAARVARRRDTRRASAGLSGPFPASKRNSREATEFPSRTPPSRSKSNRRSSKFSSASDSGSQFELEDDYFDSQSQSSKPDEGDFVEANTALQRSSQQVDAAWGEVVELRARLHEQQVQIESLEHERDFNATKILELTELLKVQSQDDVHDHLAKKSLEVAELNHEVSNLRRRLAEMEDKAESLEAERDANKSVVAELSESLWSSGSHRNSTNSQEAAQALIKKGGVLPQEDAVEMTVSHLQKKIESLEEEKSVFIETVEELHASVAELSQENEARLVKINALEKQFQLLNVRGQEQEAAAHSFASLDSPNSGGSKDSDERLLRFKTWANNKINKAHEQYSTIREGIEFRGANTNPDQILSL